MTRDKAQMDSRLKDTQSALIEEEDKGKALTKQKMKLETLLHELEDKLQKEEKVGQTAKELTFLNCSNLFKYKLSSSFRRVTDLVNSRHMKH